MNLLFISPSLKKGGAERMISYVSSLFDEPQNNVFVYAIGYGVNEVDYPNNVKVYSSEISGSGFHTFLKRSKEVKKIIVNQNIDLICSFTPFATKMAVISNRNLKKPIIASERDNPYSRNWIKRIINNHFYNKCECVVFQTDGAKKAFRGKTFRRGVIIPNPAPIVVNSSFCDNPSQIFVSAGRLTKDKDFEMLVNAFSIVTSKYHDFKLFIYGDGIEKENLEKQIISLSLENNVFLKGWGKDYLKSSFYAFILSSKTEGMPNVIIEAMTNHIPCISTDSQPGGPKELLKNGSAGILVPIGDSTKMAEAIVELIEHKEKRLQFVKEAEQVVGTLDIEIISKKWISLFNSIFAKIA